MSTREHDLEVRDLTQTSRDAAARLDAEIAAARPVPDFSAMLARARELAPEAVSAADVERAARLAPVIPLGAAERPAGGEGAALAPFVAALRGELDAKIAERRMASIPPPPLPAPRRRLGLVVGLAVAVAAALLLALVRPTEVDPARAGAGVEASAEGQRSTAGEARRTGGAPERHVLEAIVRPDAPAAEERPSAPPVPADSPRTAASPVPADSVEAPAHRARPPRPAPPAPAAAPPPGPSLEDEAQALWERGELAAAERKYREIVAVAGRSGRAELAYGDLFALVRQLRGADGPVAVWREYLGRFPAGRFADDARAGLCLREGADARAACWRDYLERHPQGAHRRQAEAALEGEGRP